MSKIRLLELFKRCVVALLMLALQAQALAHIAQSKDVGSFEKYLAHAALGCGVGALRSDSSDGCAPGATGAVVAHYGAGLLDGTTGYTLSDSEVSFYSSLAGGTAAALVGDKDAVEGNFGLGQSAGENAVKNNYLTDRDLLRALDRIKTCTKGCEGLKNLLHSNQMQGGEQVPVAGLEERCRSNPQMCTSQVQDIVQGLEALQSPETLAVLGQKNVDALVARQVSDLGRAVDALQWGADHQERNATIVKGALLVGATAVGSVLSVAVGRSLMVACAGGPLAPSCVAASTELAVTAMETAGGVPTVGMTAAGTTAVASRLAHSASNASNATDVAAVVRQAQTELAAARAGANGGVTAVDAAVATGSPITTRFVNGVTVVDQRTGAVFNGTVDLQPTFDRIAAGATGLSRNDGTVFRNLPDRTTGQILLPAKPAGYYTEYVVPTLGINGAGPQRIVTGQSGEMFYTPDHYLTFIPVKKP